VRESFPSRESFQQALDQLLAGIRSRYDALKQVDNRIVRVEEAGHTLVIEERVKSYKVKVRYQPLEEEEKKAKQRVTAQVVLQSLRRQKGK
jgi:hypothetical protein